MGEGGLPEEVASHSIVTSRRLVQLSRQSFPHLEGKQLLVDNH